ncbi:MAG: glycogen debranching protein [Jaaginema sp. PMC 1080.18]|nr:glycogen debranching protein [Jaaginema sp. PMC 1080.18]MEC4866574.1 glycogen debranching protein [Jaaginema sp. PMC 1078.18]
MTIWINEQLDPSGMIHACIASCNEQLARDCHQSFQENLTAEQKNRGWEARLRTVESWDEVPVNSLKLS